jgi:hypothetical protein
LRHYQNVERAIFARLAKKMTEAKNLTDVVELQVAYWQKQFGLASQAKQPEVSSLGIRVAGDVGIPSMETRSMDDTKLVRVVNAISKSKNPRTKNQSHSHNPRSIARPRGDAAPLNGARPRERRGTLSSKRLEGRNSGPSETLGEVISRPTCAESAR